jgi:hypothetical protein
MLMLMRGFFPPAQCTDYSYVSEHSFGLDIIRFGNLDPRVILTLGLGISLGSTSRFKISSFCAKPCVWPFGTKT